MYVQWWNDIYKSTYRSGIYSVANSVASERLHVTGNQILRPMDALHCADLYSELERIPQMEMYGGNPHQSNRRRAHWVLRGGPVRGIFCLCALAMHIIHCQRGNPLFEVAWSRAEHCSRPINSCIRSIQPWVWHAESLRCRIGYLNPVALLPKSPRALCHTLDYTESSLTISVTSSAIVNSSPTLSTCSPLTRQHGIGLAFAIHPGTQNSSYGVWLVVGVALTGCVVRL
jgi:hypothetical protein